MVKIPELTIEKIKDSNDIVDVINTYLPLKRKGANYWARCPFHNEKTASFSVSPSKQIYHCFGCSAGGNVLNFVMEYEKLTFMEALKMLAERANIPLELEPVSPREQSDTAKLREMHIKAIEYYHQQLFSDAGKTAREYLTSRGLSDETIRAFMLGYAPDTWDSLVSKLAADYPANLIFDGGLAVRSEKDGRLFDRFRDRIMFPVFDDRGHAVGFGGRLMTDKKDDAKYLNSPETPLYNKRKILYGLHVTRDNIRKEKKALVVEGYMDFLQLYQHGYVNAVAGSGTAFTTDHARLLRRFADLAVLCYDSDSAGQQAAVRTGFAVSAQKLDCKVLTLPAGEDPDSFLRREGTEAFFKKEAAALPFIDFLRTHYRPEKMSPKEKSETVSYLLEEIRNFPDPVYREMFAREIAKIFLVEEQTLLRQLNRPGAPRSRESESAFGGEKTKHFKNQGEAAEYFLLQLLVNGEIRIRKAGLRYLSPVLFKHAFLKDVLKDLLDILDKNVRITPGHIPDKIEDTKSRNFVIKLLMEEQSPENRERLFLESLKKIELQALKDEYDRLTEQLKEAMPDDVSDIMKKQMDNLNARKRIPLTYTEEIFKEPEA
jgi:DNA primase